MLQSTMLVSSPPRPYVGNPTVMTLVCGDLGSYYVTRTLHVRISTLMKEVGGRHVLSTGEDTGKCHSVSQQVHLHQASELLGPSSWTSVVSRLGERNFCFYKLLGLLMVLCKRRSPSSERWPLTWFL